MTEKEMKKLPCWHYIKEIKIPQLNEFVVKARKQYGTEEKMTEPERVMDVLGELLKKHHIVSSSTQTATFFELVKAAVFLHNLCYDGTAPSLFMAREKLTKMAKDCALPMHEVINPIFEMVESQLGADTPVPRCVPQPNSPQELMATACWMVEEYNGNKKMPACI